METNNLNKESREKKYRALLWISVVVVLIAVVFAMVKIVRTSPNTTPQYADVASSITAADWTRDNPEASITLVEYSDFECPACASFYPVLKEVHQEFGDKIKFVYRHFPLQQHVNAKLASRAAEAAGVQGKFWEMHDLLFENQQKWTRNGDAEQIFTGYAGQLGLDTEKFRTDLRSKEIGNKIDDQMDLGRDFGVTSTPTFFLNNEKMQGFNTFQQFKDMIKNEINKNS